MSQHSIRGLTAGLRTLRLSPTSTTTTTRTLARTTRPRLFTTSPALATKTIRATLIPDELVPPYPYGERLLYKQSNSGLYADKRIRFGVVRTSGRLHTTSKYKRTWRPNVLRRKRLWSSTLATWVRVRLVSRVLRTIRKCGGLDAYVLGDKPRRIKDLGPTGWKLRWLVMQGEGVAMRLNKKRRQMGLEVEETSPTGLAKKQDRAELKRIALDYATPGPLNLGTQTIIARRRMEAKSMELNLGEEAQAADVEGWKGEEEQGQAGEEYEYESMPNDGPEATAVKELEMREDRQKAS